MRFQLDAATPEGEGTPGPRGNGPLQGAGDELWELEEKIEAMREQLRAALVRKSELVAAMGTARSSWAPASERPREDR